MARIVQIDVELRRSKWLEIFKYIYINQFKMPPVPPFPIDASSLHWPELENFDINWKGQLFEIANFNIESLWL